MKQTRRQRDQRVVPIRADAGAVAVVGATVGLVALIALMPFIAPYQKGTPLTRPFVPSSPGLPFGTDHLGRDVLSQMLHSAPQTVLVPLLATLVLLAAGGAAGMGIGLLSSTVRRLALGLLDVVITVPPLVLVLILVSGSGGGLLGVIAAVVVAGFAILTRVVAAATTQIVRAGHVEAAYGYGDGHLRVLMREILPRIGGVLLAEGGLRLVAAIQLVAALSFLGLGAGLGGSWATAIRDATVGISLNPWAVLAPSIGLAVVAATVNLLADLSRRSIA